MAIGGDEFALIRNLERSGTGVGHVAIGHQDLEIALALDGDIVTIVGLGQRALRADPIDPAGADTSADLDARGRSRFLPIGSRAGARDLLIEQVLKFRPLSFVGGGVHIGDVVRDDIDIGLLREHAGRGDGQGTHENLR